MGRHYSSKIKASVMNLPSPRTTTKKDIHPSSIVYEQAGAEMCQAKLDSIMA
jgi:hypothetical protein